MLVHFFCPLKTTEHSIPRVTRGSGTSQGPKPNSAETMLRTAQSRTGTRTSDETVVPGIESRSRTGRTLREAKRGGFPLAIFGKVVIVLQTLSGMFLVDVLGRERGKGRKIERIPPPKSRENPQKIEKVPKRTRKGQIGMDESKSGSEKKQIKIKPHKQYFHGIVSRFGGGGGGNLFMCFFSPIRNDPKTKTHKQMFATHPVPRQSCTFVYVYQGAAKGGQQKELDHFYFVLSGLFRSLFGHFF